MGTSANESSFDARDIGFSIEGYRLVREIGRGGMGVVYEARDLQLGRVVAIKCIAQADGLDQKRRQLFEREAQALGRLDHDNVVRVHAAGFTGETPYLVMEYAAGGSLHDRLKLARSTSADQRVIGSLWPEAERFGHRVRSYEDEVCALICEVLSGLEAIHEARIVHRDIKPGNVLIDATGRLKVADLGLVRDLDSTHEASSLGHPKGTPRYMSPEQATGGLMGIDHRSDIFSTGVMLYELLTSYHPFDTDNYPAMVRAIATEQPPSLKSRNPNVSRDLEHIVQRAMEKNFVHRYPSAREMAQDLQCCLKGTPIIRGRPSVRDRWRRFASSQSPLSMAAFWMGCMAPIATAVVLGLALARKIPGADSIAESATRWAWVVPTALGGIGFVLACAAMFHQGRPKAFPGVLLVMVPVLCFMSLFALPFTEPVSDIFWDADTGSWRESIDQEAGDESVVDARPTITLVFDEETDSWRPLDGDARQWRVWDAPPNPDGFNLFIMIDVSGSMRKQDPKGFNREGAQLALVLTSAEDSLGLIAFNNEVKAVIPLQSMAKLADQVAFSQGIDALQSRGGTDYIGALDEMNQQLNDSQTTGQTAVIFLSDGVPEDPTTFPRITEMAEAFGEKGRRIFTIALGPGADQDLLQKMADLSGGTSHRVLDASDLLHTYLSILSNFSNRSIYNGDPRTITLNRSCKRLVYVLIKSNLKSRASLEGAIRRNGVVPVPSANAFRRLPRPDTAFDVLQFDDDLEGTWTCDIRPSLGELLVLVEKR